SMPEILSRTAKDFPNRTAILYMGKKISYSELDRLTDRFANALMNLGIKRGDKVALLLPNIPQIVVSYYGLWRMGAIPVPCNPLYTDKELEYQLNNAGATAIVSLDLLCPRMLALRSKTGIVQIVSCHINDFLPFPLKQLYPLLKKDMYNASRRRKAIISSWIWFPAPRPNSPRPRRTWTPSRWFPIPAEQRVYPKASS
ncbi:MAG: long-chain fatty acid--CoA ligase, partial [Proteobacteria bacterium]|nr:long-chain fatty acid--CoA ligase [Pseudomonadota bacterium]